MGPEAITVFGLLASTASEGLLLPPFLLFLLLKPTHLPSCFPLSFPCLPSHPCSFSSCHFSIPVFLMPKVQARPGVWPQTHLPTVRNMGSPSIQLCLCRPLWERLVLARALRTPWPAVPLGELHASGVTAMNFLGSYSWSVTCTCPHVPS